MPGDNSSSPHQGLSRNGVAEDSDSDLHPQSDLSQCHHQPQLSVVSQCKSKPLVSGSAELATNYTQYKEPKPGSAQQLLSVLLHCVFQCRTKRKRLIIIISWTAPVEQESNHNCSNRRSTVCDQTFFLSVFTGLGRHSQHSSLLTLLSYLSFCPYAVFCWAESRCWCEPEGQAEGSAGRPVRSTAVEHHRLQHPRHQGAAQAQGAAGGALAVGGDLHCIGCETHFLSRSNKRIRLMGQRDPINGCLEEEILRLLQT